MALQFRSHSLLFVVFLALILTVLAQDEEAAGEQGPPPLLASVVQAADDIGAESAAKVQDLIGNLTVREEQQLEQAAEESAGKSPEEQQKALKEAAAKMSGNAQAAVDQLLALREANEKKLAEQVQQLGASAGAEQKAALGSLVEALTDPGLADEAKSEKLEQAVAKLPEEVKAGVVGNSSAPYAPKPQAGGAAIGKILINVVAPIVAPIVVNIFDKLFGG